MLGVKLTAWIENIHQTFHLGNLSGQLQFVGRRLIFSQPNQFNQKLSCKPSELIWLGDEQPTADELELSGEVAEMEGLVDVLDPRGQFDPQQWAFEQLNLLLPVVNHCGDHCPGPPGLQQQPVIPDTKTKAVDPRWQALQQLQQQIDQP